MKKRTFRILSLVMTVLMVTLAYAAPVSAALPEEDDMIMPLYNNVDEVYTYIDYTSGKLNATLRITGLSGTTYSEGTVKIQRKYGLIYIAIEEWTGISYSSSTYTFNDSSITPASGEKYRIKYEIKATRNGSTEKISGNSNLFQAP